MGTLPSVIGPYRVVRQLGEGGMGAVFEAIHEVIQRRVAIKVLHPESGRSADTINRFINEARAANLVGHPGLVQITDFGNLADGAGYLVMEYLQGETLSGRLDQSSGKLSPSEAVHVSSQIAAAVGAAHKKGIVHRDLKPSNIMLVPDSAMPTGERVKVLDFGLAKLNEVAEAAVVKTNTHAVLGTPLYMSPEQCEGAGRVDLKSDVYSLGCMLYEMLSGQPPFVGDGPGQIIGQHLFKQPVPLGQLAPLVPVPLTALVDRLLVKSKDERPSMNEVRHELEALVGTLPPPQRRQEAEPLAATEPLQKTGVAGMVSTLGQVAAETRKGAKQRRWALFLIAGGLSLLGLASGFLFLKPRTGAPALPPPPVPSRVLLSPTAVEASSPTKPLPKSERSIQWSIVTTPPGAELVDAQGVTLGQTPWMLGRPVGSGTQAVRLHKAGYADKLLILKLDADEARDEKLEPIVTPSPRKPAASPPAQTKIPPSSQPKKDLYIDF